MKLKEVHELVQTVSDAILYCKAKLALKTPKVEEVLDLLMRCKQALVLFLSKQNTIKIIQSLAQLRRKSSARDREKMFDEKQKEKLSQ